MCQKVYLCGCASSLQAQSIENQEVEGKNIHVFSRVDQPILGMWSEALFRSKAEETRKDQILKELLNETYLPKGDKEVNCTWG